MKWRALEHPILSAIPKHRKNIVYYAKRYKRDGEIENSLKPLETTYPITGDSCSETILSVNGCSLTLDYPIQGILARVTVFLKLDGRDVITLQSYLKICGNGLDNNVHVFEWTHSITNTLTDCIG